VYEEPQILDLRDKEYLLEQYYHEKATCRYGGVALVFSIYYSRWFTRDI
jgi:hypothetical protein